MKLKPYTEYKNSGVEWLGEVPDAWGVTPLKFIAGIQTGYAFSSDDFTYEGIPALRIGDITVDGCVDFTNAKYLPEAYVTVYSKVLIFRGAIVMAMTGATIGKVGKYDHDNPALLNQRVCSFYSKEDNNQNFLWYLLSANFYLEHIKLTAFGSAQPNISDVGLLNCLVAIAPNKEQKAISTFLDRETAKLDTLIAKQEKLIELLQEKRQAIISHAVTKGLDPNVKMKDSGLDWLGMVPEHWVITRLKYLGDAIIGLTYDPTEVVYEGEGTLVLRSSNIQQGAACFDDKVYVNTVIPEKLITRLGDILICSRNGSRNLIGKNITIDDNTVGMTFGAFMTTFRTKYYKFVSCILNSSLFEFQAGSFLTSTVNQLTTGNLNCFEVPFPPEDEQIEIANYVNIQTNKIDTLISKAQKSIELAKEHRTALISAAVTGKIDVREYEQ